MSNNEYKQELPNSFDAGIIKNLENYVYRLIDPRDSATFYVGKGTGNRVFNHINNAVVDVNNEPADDDDKNAPPLMDNRWDIIQAIKRDGFQVDFVIHRYGLDEKTAFEVEAALIQAYPNLKNRQGGHYNVDRGLINHRDLVRRYALPELKLKRGSEPYNILLIKINKLQNRDDKDEVFRLVSYCWRLNKDRADDVKYVLAVCQGITCGIYEPLKTFDETDKAERKWLRATFKNFGDPHKLGYEEPLRFGFKGEPAEKEIWDKYVGEHGKRLENAQFLKAQNPVFYLW